MDLVIMIRTSVALISVILLNPTMGFIPLSSQSGCEWTRSTCGNSLSRKNKASSMSMYLEGASQRNVLLDKQMDTKKSSLKIIPSFQPKRDTTKIGSLTVPSVGVGTISWSSGNDKALQNLVSTAVSSNAGFFDTAERYGGSYKTALGLGWGETEQLLKQYLEQAEESRPVRSSIKPIVATKFTPSPWRTTVQSVVDACEESCKRLGVDQIDLYQLHMPDIVQPFRFIPGMGEPKDKIYWDGLAECYNRGLIKNIGVCNYGPSLLERCQAALDKKNVPLSSNQIAYSLIGRHNGSQQTLDYCNSNGIKTLAFYPFAMGLLTGKYTQTISIPNNALTSSLTHSKKTKLEERDLQGYAAKLNPLMDVMDILAAKYNKSKAQIALNYILCKGALPIPGSRTSSQLIDNIGAMGWRLSANEVRMLEQEADKLGFDGFEGAGFKRTSEKFVGYGVERWSLD